MRNITLYIIVFLGVSTMGSILMSADDSPRKIRKKPKKHTTKIIALEKVPEKPLTLHCRECPRAPKDACFDNTREDLFEAFKDKSLEEKNTALQTLIKGHTADAQWHERRCITAALVCAGADPNSQTIENRLHGIVYSDYTHVQLELEHGANPNLPAFLYETPLSCVQTAPIARLLMKHGAKIIGSPLHVACFSGSDSQLVAFYLQQGIHPDTIDMDGRTPLLSLVRGVCVFRYDSNIDSMLEKASLLLNAGANTAIKDRHEKKSALKIIEKELETKSYLDPKTCAALANLLRGHQKKMQKAPAQ